MLGRVKEILKLSKSRKKWRKQNSHNFTQQKNRFDMSIVEVGNFSYGVLDVFATNNTNKLKIGNFCSIADYVRFLLSADHPSNLVSTYPFKARIIDGSAEALSKGDIVIADDVWIGSNSIILSGVCLGQGSIVAAGSVVTKDVPPYAIVGGVPAKVIKYRFDEKIIKKLLSLDYSKLTAEMVKENQELFYSPLTEENIDKFIELFGRN